MEPKSLQLCLGLLLTLTLLVGQVRCHGYMLEPPSRQSAFRVGFRQNIINYDDNQQYCGGKTYQWDQQGGKCGVCGDPWQPSPRAYEHPDGRYAIANDVVAKEYAMGQMMEVVINLTQSHLGYFVFRLCDLDDVQTADATEECLQQNVLRLDNGRDIFVLPHDCSGLYRVRVQLPPNLTCHRCFFQWKYHAGNDFGCWENGRGCGKGCGRRQEEFYACADIVIRSDVSVTKPLDPSVLRGVQVCGSSINNTAQACLDPVATTAPPSPSTTTATTAVPDTTAIPAVVTPSKVFSATTPTTSTPIAGTAASSTTTTSTTTTTTTTTPTITTTTATTTPAIITTTTSPATTSTTTTPTTSTTSPTTTTTATSAATTTATTPTTTTTTATTIPTTSTTTPATTTTTTSSATTTPTTPTTTTTTAATTPTTSTSTTSTSTTPTKSKSEMEKRCRGSEGSCFHLCSKNSPLRVFCDRAQQCSGCGEYLASLS